MLHHSASILLCYYLLPSVTAIWPLPAQQSLGSNPLFIDKTVQVTYSAPGNQVDMTKHQSDVSQKLSMQSPQTAAYGQQQERPAIVSTAIDDLLENLFNQGFYPWRFHPRNSNFDPPSNASTSSIKTILLVQNASDPESIETAKFEDVDESYSLKLTTDGVATVSASTSIGISHGLATFSQLFFKTRDSKVYTPYAPVSIEDSPLYQHRGINLDVARTYYPPSSIQRLIRAMSLSKLNRLHLHATDSQSWPLEIPALPELSEKGAYAQDQTYSADTLRGLQNYATSRGIQMVIEIDMPGHTGSIFFSNPDLIVAWNVQPNWVTYALEPPSGSLKLNSDKVDSFLKTLFDDLLPRAAEGSSYFHVGGDEVLAVQYGLDETVRQNTTEGVAPFLRKFMETQLKRVRDRGLTPVIWEELVLEWNVTVGDDAIVQAWKGPESIGKVADKGLRVVAGDTSTWYLDCGQGQWLSFYQNTSAAYWPYQDYCSPRSSWRKVYAFDPRASLTPAQAKLVVGGEVHMWGEQTDPVDMEAKVWPRAAAAAEVLWSGPKDATGQNRSQIEAAPRLADFRERLLGLGVRAEPVVMPFCTQNGTQCAL